MCFDSKGYLHDTNFRVDLFISMSNFLLLSFERVDKTSFCYKIIIMSAYNLIVWAWPLVA